VQVGERWGSAPDPARGVTGSHIVAREARSVWNPAYAIFESSTGGKWLRSPWTPALSPAGGKGGFCYSME